MTHVERLFALEQFGIKLGLDAMRRLLAALGDPHERWPAVHVAGTNGKGSVSAMVDTALRAAGWRVGRYTSPHLARLEERVVVEGREVSPAVFDEALGRVFAAVDELLAGGALAASPTFFEVSTAAAFVVFADASVDAAVIEVGLGGRFDATNVLRPVVGAITSIDFDHERHLGHTIAAIAGEKAGIAKRDVPLVVGALSRDAFDVVAAAAEAAGAPLLPVDGAVTASARIVDGRTRLQLTTPRRVYPEVTLGLAGGHQVANAAVAVLVLETVGDALQRPVSPEAIVAGLRDVRWPARLEWLRHPGTGRRVLIDAAHNPAGARALASYLEDAAVPPPCLVTSIMRDKDVAGVLGPLLPRVRQVIATRAETPRASSAAELAAAVTALAGDRLPVRAIDDPWSAVQHGLHGGEPLVLAGSIFLVGPLRDALLTRGGFVPA